MHITLTGEWKKVIKKIIFVFVKYFEQKDWIIFDCPYYLKAGYEVEIWSLVHIQYDRELKEPKYLFRDNEVKYFNKVENFESEIQRNDPKATVFLLYPSLGENTRTGYMIRRFIKKHGFRYCDYFFPPVLLSAYKEELSDIWSITRYYLRNIRNIDKLRQLFFSFLYPPEYVFIEARANVRQLANKYDVLNGHRLKYINTQDYDRYLMEDMTTDVLFLEQENLERDNYIVFVDQAFTHHSDIVNEGIKVAVTEDVYGKEIRQLFDLIERQTNMEIVVALHPKAEYLNDTIFGGRKMVHGETRKLIKYCSFVICNSSTVISYIMLYKKDLLLYTTEQVKRAYIYIKEAQLALAKFLECKVVNLSKKLPDNLLEKYVCTVDELKRSKYLDEFVCSKYHNVKSSQIINKCVKNL